MSALCWRPLLASFIVGIGLVGSQLAAANVTASEPPSWPADSPDLTGNQRALAGYLHRLCGAGKSRFADDSRALCGEITSADEIDAAARAAVNAIDPSSLIDAAGSTLDLAALQNQSVLRRMAAIRGGARGIDFSNLAVQIGDQQLAGDALNAVSKPIVGSVVDGVLSGTGDIDRLGVFANGAVRTGKTGPGSPDHNDSIDLTTGIDFRLRDDLAVGAGGTYSRDASHGDAFHLASWRGSLYGTYYTHDRFHLDALLSYGTADVDSTRFVAASDVLGSGSSVAKATAGGYQLSGALTSGVDWQLGPWTFGPHVAAYYLDTQIDRLDESGAGAFNLSVGKQSAQSLRLNAGAQLGVALRLPWLELTPSFDADYVQDVGYRDDTVDVSLAGDSGTDATGTPDAGLRPNRTDAGYFVWSVGASAQWTRLVSAFVSYRTCASTDAPTVKELTWGVRFTATP